MSLKMEKLASASPSTAARLRDLERLDRRESNSSVPVSNRNGSITGIAYPVSNRRRASMFDPIDPTELQKTLYQTKNKSPNDSNSSDASLGGESIGTVEFGLQYVSDLQKLVVDLVRVFDLQFKQQAIEADQQQQQQQQPIEIYCKCTLLPDKLSFQTKMVKRSANPIFEQQFDFDYLDLAKMDSRFLEISIHECDAKFNRDDCIGVTTLKLNLPNIETKNMFLRDFKPWIRNGEENYIGDLMFSLAYLPTAERLTVVIMKARNLSGIGTDKKTAPDPYVKVSISNLDGSKKSKKKKTSTQKSTTSPIYNEEIVFTNIKKEKLNDIQLQLVVYHDSLTHREELGCVTVGSMSKSNEYIQWKDMCDGKKSIAWWQTLKSTAGHNHHQCNHQSNNDSESSQPNVHTSSTAASKRSSINAKLRKFLARSTSINR